MARYYQPEVGQFLSLDTASELPDYTYGANNPLSYQDPNGQFILDVISIVSNTRNMIKEPSWANAGWLASDLVSLLLPGNISLAAKAGKAAKNAAKKAFAPKKIGKTDTISSGGKKIQSKTGGKQNPSQKPNANKNSDSDFLLDLDLQFFASEDTSKTVDDLIKNAKHGRVTKGRTAQYELSGGFDNALKDFESLQPEITRNTPELKVGNLKDGRTVIVRSKSSDGSPTIEIQDGKRKIKFRY